jgi:hypothetical protein
MCAKCRTPRLLIGQIISHYRVVAKVGVGGMGEVYRDEPTGAAPENQSREGVACHYNTLEEIHGFTDAFGEIARNE